MLDLACKEIANQIKGKTTEQLRQHFGIVNDFSPEEEEQVPISAFSHPYKVFHDNSRDRSFSFQIRKENAWLDD
jgi:hypothetical protein